MGGVNDGSTQGNVQSSLRFRITKEDNAREYACRAFNNASEGRYIEKRTGFNVICGFSVLCWYGGGRVP